MVAKIAEPKFEINTARNRKLSARDDLTEVQKLSPVSLSLTPEEILLVRDFIGIEFPYRIHDVQIDDMNYIQCVSNVFRKMTAVLKELGLDVEEFDDI